MSTFTQINVQIVFSVKNRDSLIKKTWRDKLYHYIAGIITNSNHKILAINGMKDHIHILITMKPSESISELVQKIKRDSSLWVNENKFVIGKFAWQEGFGAFTYSRSQVPVVVKYIRDQEKHHTTKSYSEELKHILDSLGVEYNPKYFPGDIKDGD